MDYNEAMQIMKPQNDSVLLIRFAAILWLCYLSALAIINRVFPQAHVIYNGRLQENNNILYYVLYGAIAVICFGLAYWTWIQQRLGKVFLPLIIVITTVLPIIINQVTGQFSPLGTRFGSPEGSVLAMFPFLFIGLLLVAWHYQWQYMLFVILGITALNIGLAQVNIRPFFEPFVGVIMVILIQSVVFLVVGFSITFLMSRLRAQQKSLEDANMRLTHHASALEQLATSRERNRLALELHDTLAHTLSGLSVQLETVKAYWDVDRNTAKQILEQSLTATHQGLEETRRTLKALRASPLDDLGLALALRRLSEDAAQRANLSLDMPEISNLPPLSPDVEQCIYRVTQEAIANAAKHASAKKLTVKLVQLNGKVVLTVQDDGAGFDVKKEIEAGHFGLSGMQERAKMVGGILEVKSGQGAGTAVSLTI